MFKYALIALLSVSCMSYGMEPVDKVSDHEEHAFVDSFSEPHDSGIESACDVDAELDALEAGTSDTSTTPDKKD